LWTGGGAVMSDGVGEADDFGPMDDEWNVPTAGIESRAECLIQLLAAYRDIADFDDIHQAMERLTTVQDWIRREARAAASDPVFTEEPESMTA
jgi:hypothetical protein